MKKTYLISFDRDGIKFECKQTFYVDDNGEEYESGYLIDYNSKLRRNAYKKALNRNKRGEDNHEI